MNLEKLKALYEETEKAINDLNNEINNKKEEISIMDNEYIKEWFDDIWELIEFFNKTAAQEFETESSKGSMYIRNRIYDPCLNTKLTMYIGGFTRATQITTWQDIENLTGIYAHELRNFLESIDKNLFVEHIENSIAIDIKKRLKETDEKYTEITKELQEKRNESN